MRSFKIFGVKLKTKTSNVNGQSSKDCGELWQYFEKNKIAESIPDKTSDAVYAVYHEYASGENGLFSYFIGCRVKDDAVKPENLDELNIPEQAYHIETARGKMTGCITEAWEKIRQSSLNRTFGYDFEVYDEISSDWNDAEIDIYISVQ